MSRKVCGVGTNDADYHVRPLIEGNKVTCTFYQTWHSMLTRCYSKREQKRSPTYTGCIVCPEWMSFMTFKAWMESQDWEGKQLDKDLVGDGQLYSPETCCFVDSWLNNLFTDCGKSRGEYPIGVYCEGEKYRAQLSVDNKRQNLGRFDTPEKAHQAYLTAKKNYVILKMRDYPDQQIKHAVLEKVNGN